MQASSGKYRRRIVGTAWVLAVFGSACSDPPPPPEPPPNPDALRCATLILTPGSNSALEYGFDEVETVSIGVNLRLTPAPDVTRVTAADCRSGSTLSSEQSGTASFVVNAAFIATVLQNDCTRLSVTAIRGGSALGAATAVIRRGVAVVEGATSPPVKEQPVVVQVNGASYRTLTLEDGSFRLDHVPRGLLQAVRVDVSTQTAKPTDLPMAAIREGAIPMLRTEYLALPNAQLEEQTVKVSLLAATAPAPIDAFEPDDTLVAAKKRDTRLQSGAHEFHSLTNGRDVDVIPIDVPKRFRGLLSYVPASERRAVPHLRLVDGEGVTIAEANARDNSTERSPVLRVPMFAKAQRLFLIVSRHDNESTPVSYQVAFTANARTESTP